MHFNKVFLFSWMSFHLVPVLTFARWLQSVAVVVVVVVAAVVVVVVFIVVSVVLVGVTIVL